MENVKKFKDLSVSERLLTSEMLATKVAKIINKVRAKCNLLLQPTGYGVNIKIDFYALDEAPVEVDKEEVISG